MTVITKVINTEIHYHDEAKSASIIIITDKYIARVAFNRVGIDLSVAPTGVNGCYSLRSKNGVWTSETFVTDVSYAIFTIEFIEKIMYHLLTINIFEISAGDSISAIFPYKLG